MTCVIYWFRNDLRLQDNPALAQACQTATHLLPVFCHDPALDAETPWGFTRAGEHRRQFLKDTLADLSQQLTALGSGLIELQGRPQDALPELASRVGAQAVFCETIAAPEETAAVEALQAVGLRVTSVWQSSMLTTADLPFEPAQLPDVFTSFRQAIERADVRPAAVMAALSTLPPLPVMTP